MKVDVLRELRSLASDAYDEDFIQVGNRLMAVSDVVEALIDAAKRAEAALSDIGDADREPGDDIAWAEERAAMAIPELRHAIAKVQP